MAFSVGDFQHLLRLLAEHPEWREELRRQLLTEELLALPTIVRDLAQRVDDLTERVDRLTEQVEKLTEGLDRLVSVVATLSVRTDELRGWRVEEHYRLHAYGLFSTIARRLRTLERNELWDVLDHAVDAGALTHDDAVAVSLADVVARGRRDGEDVYLVVEASVTVGREDVQRAAERAQLLSRTGQHAVPVAAGAFASPEAAALAAASGVWLVTDGRAEPPSAA